MRGPLLSGVLASAPVLGCVADLIRERVPTLVVGPTWLAATLAQELPVALLAPPEDRDDARKAARKVRRRGHALPVLLAGDALPLASGHVPAIVAEGVAELDLAVGAAWVEDLARVLAPGGVLVAMDATGDPKREALVMRTFVAAGLTRLTQQRPKDGALVSAGWAPVAAVQAARFQVEPEPARQ